MRIDDNNLEFLCGAYEILNESYIYRISILVVTAVDAVVGILGIIIALNNMPIMPLMIHKPIIRK